MIGISVAYLCWDYWKNQRVRGERSEIGEKEGISGDAMDVKKPWILFSVGVLMVVVGSRMLVVSGIAIASAWGIPSVIIGLSVIAVGTSLPELVTGITAARKGVPDLSVGNVVGANVLNLALIVGVSATIRPLTLERFTQVYSYPWLVVFILVMVFMFRRKGSVGRAEDIMLLALYSVYLIGLFVFSGAMKT